MQQIFYFNLIFKFYILRTCKIFIFEHFGGKERVEKDKMGTTSMSIFLPLILTYFNFNVNAGPDFLVLI